MTDKYTSFGQLSTNETEGEDFERTYLDRKSEILVLAPHAGGIEPGTGPIARAISGEDWSLYLFRGLKAVGNGELHITSRRFDEPIAERAVAEARFVLTVHGQKTTDEEFVEVGGLHRDLRIEIRNRLDDAGFAVRRPPKRRSGMDPKNICNRGQKRGGIQLEVSRMLRDTLSEDGSKLRAFAESVRMGLEECHDRQE